MIHFNIYVVPKDIPEIYRPPSNVLVVCVGSIKSLPEAMAPLTGSILHEADINVVGSLAEPVLDEDEVKRNSVSRLIIKAVASKDAQPGYTELEAYPRERRWTLQVHLPPKDRVHYSDIVRYARATAVAVPRIIKAKSSNRRLTKSVLI